MSSYWFRVYVAGRTERTWAAVMTMQSLCESWLPGRYQLDVIDTVERPDLAENDAILIAPTVLRVAPEPQRRVYGDLSDHDRVISALGLHDPVESHDGGEA